MDTERHQPAQSAKGQPPSDWARLLRKLRWIGLEAEAERLELVVLALPLEQRSGVSVAAPDTD